MSTPVIGKIKETIHIPLGDIQIGVAQFRTTNIMKGIEELALNIKTIGLINAILVCELDDGKYELITGQRRYLAHQHLQEKTIRANVLEKKDLTDDEKRILSVGENITIKSVSRENYQDACTDLYRKYGTIKAVSAKLGLDYATVSDYVHYEQLIQPLKALVDRDVVSVKTAKRAQQASITDEGEINEEAAIAYAKEMRTMSSEKQRKMVKIAEKSKDKDPAAIIEEGRKQTSFTRLSITIADDVNTSLEEYAQQEGTKPDDAASSLIVEGLETKGYLEKD